MDMVTIYGIVILVVSIVLAVILCIIAALKFQKKQKKKYSDLEKIINERQNEFFCVKDGLSYEDIVNIDNSVNVNELMKSLYETYLSFEDKIKNSDKNFDGILTGFFKDFYINKIDNYKINGYKEINDRINLTGYSISEFSKDKLKFKIDISCFNYKMLNDSIVSGSNLYRVQQIALITYEKVENKWLISNYDKIYERKLSD